MNRRTIAFLGALIVAIAAPSVLLAQASPPATGLTGNPLTQLGDHMVSGGNGPTLGAGCGTGAAVVGTDTAGHMLTGVTTSNPCLVTFRTGFGAQRPTCIIVGETSPPSFTVAPNGVSFSITNPADNLRYYWICIGRPAP